MTAITIDGLCLDCKRPLPIGPKQGAQKRCAACSLARTNFSLMLGMVRDGHRYVPVDCWCKRTTVWVRAEDNLRGLTGSCGIEQCRRAA